MSSDLDRVPKRPRINTTADDTAQSLRRSDVWYDDGNVILVAGSTQFKIFKGILYENSPIFRDMFSLSTPSASETIDGCPVVHLSDTAEEVEHMLRALHNRRYFRSDVLQPIAVVSALLRLGKKYGIDHLRDDSIALLQKEWPSSLEELLAIDGYVAICEEPAVTIDAISLASETGVLSILPIAFYTCLNNDLIWGLEGEQRNDGTIATLSSDNQRRYLGGKEKVLWEQAAASFAWLHDLTPCGSADDCTQARRALFINLWNPLPQSWALEDWNEEWNDDLCPACIAGGKQRFEAARQIIWDKLPSLFDLPPWNELIAASSA
ncbi:hypothetical protein JAAARDRAFT_79101 [Jaapia argillacea MUCL 33604]|uniref:BTB domain-containing protein n=1 Tax=Jaapia argillacea MUCL 33604 TaxID=933084 RepID=A0A067PP35_9AGAM|nr:hypothetical protein JAAARDRAFT_79101 [Jaapia argillacea MUCL 33604]